jgi:hypothetical protein
MFTLLFILLLLFLLRRIFIYHWFFIFAPLVLSLLVPLWLFLSDFLCYELFFAPDPVSPRYDSTWLSAAFYIVWWPLLLLFVSPGATMAHPFMRFLSEGNLRLSVSGVLAGVVYSAALLCFRVFFRRTSSRGSQNA